MNQRTNIPLSGFGSASFSERERRFPSMIGLNRLEIMNRAIEDTERQRQPVQPPTAPAPPTEAVPPPQGAQEPPYRPSALGFVPGVDQASETELLLTSGIARGTGAMLSGAGGAVDAATRWLDERDLLENKQGFTRLANMVSEGANRLGARASAWGDWFEEGLEPETRAALKQQIFEEEADLLRPSTWSLDDEASADAVISQTTRTFGEMVPVVLGGAYRAVIGAVSGGLQSFHYGEEGAKAVVERAAETGELQETPGYMELREQGMGETEAINMMVEQAGDAGGALAALSGAAGGAVLGRVASRSGFGRRALTRAASGAGIAGVTEGTQEVLEGMGSRAGANIAAEQELIGLTEGSLEEFVMGAVAGGPFGVAGAGRQGDAPEPDAPEPLTPEQRVDTPLRLEPEQRVDAPLRLEPEQRVEIGREATATPEPAETPQTQDTSQKPEITPETPPEPVETPPLVDESVDTPPTTPPAPPESVETAPKTPETPETAPDTPKTAPEPVSDRPQAQVREVIQPMLAGDTNFQSITQARKAARTKGVEASNKQIDEGIEEAVVRVASDIAQDGISGTPGQSRDAFDRIADLHERQPGLNVRTTTSMTDQAYSTPAPIAYAAGRMANIAAAQTIYEPSAGNGMLLIGAQPGAQVTANELNPERVASLREFLPNMTVTEGDATSNDQPAAKSQDVVIANPPFGRVTNAEGQQQLWPMTGNQMTDQVDHAIAFRALETMKDEGRAVLIVGGVRMRGEDAAKPDSLKLAYRAGPKRKFYGNLYQQYNVTHHIRLPGNLYKKQGAQWPVDMIVIEGRGAATRAMPMAVPPEEIGSMDDLGAWLTGNAPEGDGAAYATAAALEVPDTQPEPVTAPTGSAPVPVVEPTTDIPDTPPESDRAATLPPTPVAAPEAQDGQGADGSAEPVGDTAQEPPEAQPEPPVITSDPTAVEQNAINTDQPMPPDAPVPEPDIADAPEIPVITDIAPDPVPQPVEDTPDPEPDSRTPDDLPNPDVAVAPAPAEAMVEPDQDVDTGDLQRAYQPVSTQNAIGTMSPANMAPEIRRNMVQLRDSVGDLGQYVADKLGMDPDDLGKHFAAEQIDGIAAAVNKMENGESFTGGHQTGLGKGRISAAILIYARKQGKIPIFVTEKPELYADMVRDLRDIGQPEGIHERIAITNAGMRGKKAIRLSEADPKQVIASMTPAQLEAVMQGAADGTMPEGVDFIFTTYDQMTGSGAAGFPKRAHDLMKVAPNAIIVLDESHNAGGTASGRGRKKKDQPDKWGTRAEYFRDLVKNAQGTLFLSATFSKNPSTMTLYETAGFKGGLDDMGKLETIVQDGGVPLEQWISQRLAASGNLIRLETSFDGIAFETTRVDVGVTEASDGVAGEVSSVMRDMLFFDKGLKDTRVNRVESWLAQGGQNITADEISGIDQVSFGATMHNVVSQMLLTLKAPAVADQAIASIKRGEKPLIYIENTNEAMLNEVIEQEQIAIGDPVAMNLGDVLTRQLDRILTIRVKDAQDNVHELMMNPNDLSGTQRKEYDRIRNGIADLNLSDVNLSALPIDMIRDRVTAAGYNIDEITGRSSVVKDGILKRRRTGAEAKRGIREKYNSGKLDALVINRSGSTGVSLHAMNNVGDANDGKPRHMIIMQPAPDPNTFMQSLGRVNRTGQSVKPTYEFVFADLPAESRFVSLLLRKLASLNANVSGARQGQVEVEGADYFNKVGDRVWAAWLDENTETAAMLNLEDAPREDIARKATGRIAVLPPREAADILESVDEDYARMLAELVAANKNPLMQMQIDMDAHLLGYSVMRKGTGKGAFGDDTRMSVYSVKRQGKKVEYETAHEKAAANAGDQAIRDKFERVLQNVREVEVKAPFGSKERRAMHTAGYMLKVHRIGLRFNYGDIPGVVTDIHVKDGGKKLSNIQIEITHAFGTARVPLSALIKSDSIVQPSRDGPAAHEANWREMHAKARETRVIMTGNLLNGMENAGEGSIARFTTAEGEVDTGIIMSKKAKPQELMNKPLSLSTQTTQSLAEFLVNGNRLTFKGPKDTYGVLYMTGEYARVVVSKGRGSRSLVTGQDVKGLANFTKNYSGEYSADIGRENLAEFMLLWRENRDVAYYPGNKPEEQETAYKAFGLEKPEFVTMDVPEDILNQTAGAAEALSQPEATQRLVRDDPARAPKRSVAELREAMTAELLNLGVGSKVSVQFSDQVLKQLNGSFEVARYANAVITVATRQQNHEQSIRHEAIHALRDRALWGREGGLFTDQEWETLSNAAARDSDLMQETRDLYDLDGDALIEEAVAEMYARHAQRVAQSDTRLNRVLEKIRQFFRGMRRALTGYTSAEQVMSDISLGRIGARSRREFWDPDAPDRVSNLVTDAMGAKGGANVLGIVPLHPLVTEVGERIPSLRHWLILKRNSDAERLAIHNHSADVVKEWTRLWRTDRKAGAELNAIMHESTLANLFPTQRLDPPGPQNTVTQDRYEKSLDLNDRYKALPEPFKRMYWKIRREYTDLSDRLRSALEDNINHQTGEGLKRINDRYDTKSDAATTASGRAEIEAQRDAAISRFEDATEKTLKGLRLQFENLRKSVYFPLGRYGKYAVNVVDTEGETVSFSLFETSKAQQAFARDIAARPQDYGLDQDIEVGTHLMDDAQSLRDAVPGSFVASVENMIAERDDLPDEAREQLMDQIWQTWLRTFPDLSIRKAHIHRKGTPGFTNDAIRNFADRNFHAGHQISRTRVGGRMDSAMNKAKEEARETGDNRERAQFVVQEVERRNEYWHQPDVSPWVANLNQYTFLYYLGVTPGAALVNLSQTTILGPGILGSRYQAQGVKGAVKEIAMASRDFAQAGFDFSKDTMASKPPKRLTKDERKAMAWARDMGLIERTETFALAEMAEQGVQANPDRFRNRALNVFAWSFQASEIANRSVTMLAAYRMARKAGRDHDTAMNEAWDNTLKMHFDMSSTARPRFIQSDTARVIAQFKQFSINIAVRLALDTRKAIHGATPEQKREARIMLGTTMTAFLLHAGIRGLPLYGTVAMIMGLFLPGEGGEDDLERMWANSFSDEEGMGPAVWNTMLKIALDGPLGAVTDTNLRDRIGAASLFFYSRTRTQDASETWGDMASELLGPAWGMGENVTRGIDMIAEGNMYRGVETAMPKFIRDIMKGARYAYEGEITTLRGDTLVEKVTPIDAVRQAIGFSSLSMSEQYRLNARLKNDQKRIRQSRGRILRDIVKTIQAGGRISHKQTADIMQFNSEYPGMAITMKSIERSFASRTRRSLRTTEGVYLEPGIDRVLRERAGVNPYQ